MARRQKETDGARKARLEKAADASRSSSKEAEMIDAAIRESLDKHGA